MLNKANSQGRGQGQNYEAKIWPRDYYGLED